MARAAPTDLALSDFEVRTEESAVKPAASVAAGGPPRRTMRFTVKGLAKDLSQAVDFQAQLRENELFRNVRLAGTFEGKAFNQRPVTAFEITFQVDLAAGDDEFAEAGGGAR